MKYYKFSLLFLFSFTIACNQATDIKLEYYPNGEIKSKSYYTHTALSKTIIFDETGDTTKIEYFDSSGELNLIYVFDIQSGNRYFFEVKDDVPNGTAKEVRKDGYQIIRHYEDDTLHGKELHITPEYDTIKVNWYLNGETIISEVKNKLSIGDTSRILRFSYGKVIVDSLKEITTIEETGATKEFYFYENYDFPLGALNYDADGTILPNSSDYFTISLPDTVNLGDSVQLSIKTYYNHLNKNFKQIKLAIGELDNNLSFICNPMKFYGELGKPHLSFTLPSSNNGYNFIQGILTIETTNNQEERYPFFADFYVNDVQ